MILPDVNLLIYAYDPATPQHDASRDWWQRLLNGTTPVGLPWAVTCAYVRLSTHPRVRVRPVATATALADVKSWLERPLVSVLEPGPRHLEIMGDLLARAGAGGNLVSDAHLAALAIEHGCELHSNDTDFARFAGLKWRNPLAVATR